MDNSSIPPAPEGDEGGVASFNDYVMISRAEVDALRSRAGAAGEEGAFPSRSESPARFPEEAEAASKRASLLDESAARGREAQATQEIASRDRRVAELEQSCKSAVRDRELATALAGKSLVAGAASQLIKLWREEFDAYEEGGAYKVAAKDGRTVGQVVNEWLASPEYSHFCLPTSRGGAGARDANRPSGNSASQNSPKNLGEAIVMRWREETVARPNNLLKPIGLRRHR
jgi:hypothetical protein